MQSLEWQLVFVNIYIHAILQVFSAVVTPPPSPPTPHTHPAPHLLHPPSTQPRRVVREESRQFRFCCFSKIRGEINADAGLKGAFEDPLRPLPIPIPIPDEKEEKQTLWIKCMSQQTLWEYLHST